MVARGSGAAGVVRPGGRPARSRPAAGPQRQPVGLVGRSGSARPGWSPAAISTRCRTAAPSTVRSASCRRLPPSTCCGAGVRPGRPLGVAVFTEEEGARFGVACLGSRLLTGAPRPGPGPGADRRDGMTLAEAMRRRRPRPGRLGRTRDAAPGRRSSSSCTSSRAGRWSTGTRRSAWPRAIWPHGRWRFDFTGEANHAGTTRMADRRDPMLPFAPTVLRGQQRGRRARRLAPRSAGSSVAPNATNAVPARSRAWLDARAADEATLVVAAGRRRGPSAPAATAPRRGRSSPGPPLVDFDAALRGRGVARRGARRARPCCRPGPGTTPASSPPPACRPRCCSCATRPASRTAPAEHAGDRRLRAPASPRSPPCWRTWLREVTHLLVRARPGCRPGEAVAGRAHRRSRTTA